VPYISYASLVRIIVFIIPLLSPLPESYQAQESGTGCGREIRMPTENVYEISGTGFCREMKMLIKNLYEILGTEFGMEI
jgi:hypothetical protein